MCKIVTTDCRLHLVYYCLCKNILYALYFKTHEYQHLAISTEISCYLLYTMYKGIVDDGVLVWWVKKLKHTISHGSSANLCASPHQPSSRHVSNLVQGILLHCFSTPKVATQYISLWSLDRMPLVCAISPSQSDGWVCVWRLPWERYLSDCVVPSVNFGGGW